MVAWIPLYLGRLATAPALRVEEEAGGRTRVAIEGLVCGWCAARTRAALARVPGVGAVSVDLARGVAEVRHAADGVPGEVALQRALAGVVVARWARRWIAWVAVATRRGRA